MQLPPDSVFDPTKLRLGRGRTMELGPRSQLMGIVNVTPDSFSDGGRHDTADAAVKAALGMVGEGADIIDIGGESTRPGADPVTALEEQRRIMPVIEALSGRDDVLVSVDTWRAETARLAVAAGAHIINDVHGLQREPEIAQVAAQTGAGLCIMHTGRGRDGHRNADLIADQLEFFGQSLAIARDAGVGHDSLVLDPGFGFAKNAEDNLELMARFEELHVLGLPWLVGTSRKRFLGSVTGHDVAADRDIATAATTAMLRLAGASIFRVHDVAASRDALAMADAVIAAASRNGGNAT